MNRYTAALLRSNARLLVPQAHLHAMYRRLKREWALTPHSEKDSLHSKMERGIKLYLNPDTGVPAVRAKFKAAEERRKARVARKAKRKAFEAAGGPDYLNKGFTVAEAWQAIKDKLAKAKAAKP